MTFQAPKTIPGLEREPDRALTKALTSIQNELAVLDTSQHVTRLQTEDYLAKLGEFVRVTPPATGLQLLLPPATVQNAGRAVLIAVESSASGGSVTLSVVGSTQRVNDAASIQLTAAGLTLAYSTGTAWATTVIGTGGGAGSLAATLLIGNATGGTDVNFTGGSELQIAGAPGAAGQVLTSAGAGLSPTWAAAAGGSDPRIFAWFGV